MQKSLPYGIRYMTDVELMDSGQDYGYLRPTLDLLEAHFKGTGLNFYMDMVDVDQHVIGGVKCQDILGWVVPDSEAGPFKRWWLNASPGQENDAYAYAMVNWVQGSDGKPMPEFDLGDDD